MDVLAFPGVGGARDRFNVREHSVRQHVRGVGCGNWLYRFGGRLHI